MAVGATTCTVYCPTGPHRPTRSTRVSGLQTLRTCSKTGLTLPQENSSRRNGFGGEKNLAAVLQTGNHWIRRFGIRSGKTEGMSLERLRQPLKINLKYLNRISARRVYSTPETAAQTKLPAHLDKRLDTSRFMLLKTFLFTKMASIQRTDLQATGPI